LAEEPCQCSDCQRFYKEHDRLIREFPTFKQQQELNWASIQSFRTLCSKVTNELQRQLSERESKEDNSSEEKHISDTDITQALDELESVNAYLYSIEALMEKIFDTKISNKMNQILKKFQISNSIIILDKTSKDNVEKSIRNIPNIKVTDINHFSAFDIVKFEKVVFTETSVKELEKRYA